MSGTLLTLVAFAALCWLAVISRYSRQAVWLLLLWIPVQGWFQLNVFNDSSATVLLYEVQIIALYVVFGLKALKAPQLLTIPPPLLWTLPFVGWVLLLVPSSIATNGLLLTTVALRTYLLPLPLVWIGYHAFAHRRQLETVTALILLELPLIAVITLQQTAGRVSLGGSMLDIPVGFGAAQGFIVRPPGTFSSPGHLGMYVLFAIPLAMGLLGLKVVHWKRVCYALGLAGATIALIANTQRATIVLLVIVLPLIVILARRGQALWRAALPFAIIAAVGTIGLQQGGAGTAFRVRIQSIADDVNYTMVINPLNRMADALRTPVLGDGLGIASPGVGRLMPSSSITRAENERAHSVKPAESFMAALVYQMGVPGLLLFFLFIWQLMRSCFAAMAQCRRTDAGLFAAAIFSTLVAVLIHSWAYDPLHYPPGRVLFWFWAGALLALPNLGGVVAAPARLTAAQQRLTRRHMLQPGAAVARRSPAPPLSRPAR